MSKSNHKPNDSPKITDFFGSRLENKNNAPKPSVGEYQPMNPNFKSTTSAQQSTRQPQEKATNFESHDFESFKYESKAPTNTSNTSNVDIDDCWTYALPCYIPRIWKVVKPLLLDIKNGKIQNIDGFLALLRKIILTHYDNPPKDLHLKNLHTLLIELKPEAIAQFYKHVLPFLAKLALEVETLFLEPLCILKQNRSEQVNLNKKQVACLVTQMFFCTLHTQNNTKLRADCNFTQLYKGGSEKTKVEKLKCIYNYFLRIHTASDDDSLTYHNLTYERLCLKVKVHGHVNLEFWQASQKPMRKCEIKYTGSIEDEKGAIQVDFANMDIGGGVLNTGCVQEEIRFAISPELMVSMLITERLGDPEALLITGSELYCKYTGYRDSFKFAGSETENLGTDNFLRKDSMVLAIDAVNFSMTTTKNVQFKIERMLRELNKAYIGFTGSESEDQGAKKMIATGKWGCGAFRGDTQLKFILQWIAASQAGRVMIFNNFDSDRALDSLERVIKMFKEARVGELVQKLVDYNMFLFEQKGSMHLFDFLIDVE